MKKKIAFVTFADLPLPATKGGAVETLIDNLCRVNEEQDKISIDVYSVYNEKAKAQAKKQDYKNTRYFYYYQEAVSRFSVKNIIYHLTGISILNGWMKKLVEQINKNQYDFVIITSIFRELYGITKQIETKVVWYLHGDAIPVLGQTLCCKISNRCAAVISVSDFVGNQIALTGTRSKQITVRNCVDLKRIGPDERNNIRATERNNYRILNEDFVFLYVGRINPIKGVKELVEAFAKLNKPRTKLLIAGAASTEDEKKYLEEILSIANGDVLFSGYIEHEKLNALFEMCDMVVVPSVCNEAASLVVLEAQECGKAVIASNRGGIPEYANPKMTIFVETDESFVKNLRDAMKAAARTKVQEYDMGVRQTPMNYYLDFCEALKQI